MGITASIDISAEQRQILLSLLKKYLPNTQVWAFGSRVKWTTRSNSDLDLVAFTNPQQDHQISALKEAFEESNLPFRVDLLVWDKLPENFKRNIQERYEVLVEANDLERGWVRSSNEPIKVTDFIEFNPKRTLSKDVVAPFVDMASLPVDSRDISFIYEREFKGSGSKFKNGDTLFARITPCLENGKTAKVSGLLDNVVAHGSTEFIVMAAKEPDFDEDYVYYLARLPEFRLFAQARMEGTSGRQRVPWQALVDFRFDFPQKEQRKKIGRILSTIDNKIELNRQINQTLEQIAQALFKSWFVDFEPVKAKIAALNSLSPRERVGVRGQELAEQAALCAISGKTPEQLAPQTLQQLKTTAALFPDALVDSELGEIPEGWEVRQLSSIISVIGGGTPMRSEETYWNGDIPWFSVKDVPASGDVFVVDTIEKISEQGLRKSSTKLLPIGTTIITARGTVGKLALVGTPMCMNQSCYGIRGIDGIGAYFNYFNLREAITTLQQNTHGAVFDTITTQTFDSYSMAICIGEITQKFDEMVKPILERIESNVREAIVLGKLRDSVLPKLLSGEIDLANLDEAA